MERKRIQINDLTDECGRELTEEDVRKVTGGDRIFFEYHYFQNTTSSIDSTGQHVITGALVKIN